MWDFKPKKITSATLGLEAKIAPTTILATLHKLTKTIFDKTKTMTTKYYSYRQQIHYHILTS